MQVPKVGASISEVDAAPFQRRSYGRAWYFGNREFSYRQRDLGKRTVVGGMRRLVNCRASVLEGRDAGDCQRHCHEPFDPQMLQLSFPGQGETAGAKLSHQLGVALVEAVAQAHRIPLSLRPHSILDVHVWSVGHTDDVRVRENQQGTEAELTWLVNMEYIVKYDSLESTLCGGSQVLSFLSWQPPPMSGLMASSRCESLSTLAFRTPRIFGAERKDLLTSLS